MARPSDINQGVPNEKDFSIGKFWLERTHLSDEAWKLIGQITAMSGLLESSLREMPAYIKHGYYGEKYWEFENRPSWNDLFKNLKKEARKAELGDLTDEFCHSAGAAKTALKNRGILAHSTFVAIEKETPIAVNYDFKDGNIDKIITDTSVKKLEEILQNLIDAYDGLESCRAALGYARSRQGSLPVNKRISKIAIALKEKFDTEK
ncbi:MAG: hypothetical protein COA85_12855 [Robiginitomaculum sp.]|nr:MAG: hypothetical protein COA85_12855 [Robiginitomaculum sp.]